MAGGGLTIDSLSDRYSEQLEAQRDHEWAGQLTLAFNSPSGPPTARVYDVTLPGVHGPG